MIQAILFDSDGVLVDSERIFFEATRDAFEPAGASLSADAWARWYLAEGRRSREVAALIGIPSARVPETIARRDALFRDRIASGAPLRPGVAATVAGLARRFRLAVVTGAARMHYERVHSSSGLSGFFETVVTSDDCEHEKPHPQAYLTALRRLALPAGKCLAVEDSPRGAAAARAAGIRCCVVRTPLTEVSLCPPGCTILDHFTDLDRVLDREEAPT
jgi:HAD superfamily hydrolase (TIGR01509 family)